MSPSVGESDLMLCSRVVSIHEAAHAVARVHVGSVATVTEVRSDGSGMSHGTGEQWISAAGGQYALWDLLIVLLAGAIAEARIRKCSVALVFLTAASDDVRDAQSVIGQLASDGFAKDENAAWLRAESETLAVLKERRQDILTVAQILRERGRLQPEELLAALKTPAHQQP